MPLQLRVEGVGYEAVRTLQPDGAELVLGRDADCDLCLPDPQRNVSRRHLAVWNDGEQLHFKVLSVVNGVEMPFGEAPPGAQGVLPIGQTLRLADYNLSVALSLDPVNETDPWAVFDTPVEGPAAVQAAAPPAPVFASKPPEDDPFGDWGFETTFGPSGVSGGSLQADQLGAASDLGPLFRGLGLDQREIGTLSEGELETLGRLLRGLAVGLIELHAAALGGEEDVHARDRTMLASRDDNNPLKKNWPLAHKLRYMFGGRGASVGFPMPERAAHELLVELLAHQVATQAAARSAVAGVLGEFEPQGLKARLLPGPAKLFESGRAWDAFVRDYGEQGADSAQWVQRLFDKHFTGAYLRERARVRAEALKRKP